MRILCFTYLCLAGLFFFPPQGLGQTAPPDFTLTTLNDQLASDAVGFAMLPGERFLIINYQSGKVQLLVNGTLKPEPLLTVPNIRFSSEQGLLGIALDPDFPDSNYVYLFHTRQDLMHRVTKYTLTGDLTDPSSDSLEIDPASRQILMEIIDETQFHNGGTLRFGPDKKLYVSVGDDSRKVAIQDFTTRQGKIFRINRDGSIPTDNPVFPDEPADKLGEIFAIGLRNPFRFSIDPQTGALFIGDVGAVEQEEVNLCWGGENFGWPRFEGDTLLDTSQTLLAPLPTAPLTAYRHSPGSYSAIGLASYRPVDYPNDASFPAEFDGALFYLDFFRGPLRYLAPTDSGYESRVFGSGYYRLADAAIGPDGSLYVLEFGTSLIRISYDNPLSREVPEAFDFGLIAIPNPFSDETTFRFSLPKGGIPAELTLFDPMGKQVRRFSVPAVPGEAQLSWDGNNADGFPLSSGLYLYRLSQGGHQQTGKVWLRR